MKIKYIRKDYALANVQWAIENHSPVDEAIECTTTEDVAPVVHSKWIYRPFYNGSSRGAIECKNCKGALEGSVGFNYCPNCGCKMDLK